MSMAIDVSIICLVYKSAERLHRCFDSILAQDFQGTYEVIVCTDAYGGGDGTWEILQDYKAKYPDIFVISHSEERSGLANSRQRGYDLVRGEYVYAVDADDELRHDALRLLVEAAKKNNADLVNCSFYTAKGSKEHARATPFRYPARLLNRNKAFAAYMNDASFRGFLWTKLFKAELLKKRPQLRMRRKDTMFEDVSIVAWLLSNCDKVATITEPLYYYYKDNPESEITHPRTDRAKWHIAVFTAIRIYLQKIGNEDLIRIFRRHKLRIYISVAFDLSLDKKFGADKEYRRTCKKHLKAVYGKAPLSEQNEFLGELLDGVIIEK